MRTVYDTAVTSLDGRLRTLLLAALLLPALARAEAPTGEAPSTPAAPSPAPAQPPAPPAAAPDAIAFEGPGLEVRAGLGYYEAANASLAWRITERNEVGVLAGSNFGIPKSAVNTLGLDWRYIERKLAGFESAFLVRALYWTARDDLYHWRLFSVQAGGSFSWPIAKATSLILDATLVRTFVVESDRQQDQAFGNPQKWNVSACLSVSRRVATW